MYQTHSCFGTQFWVKKVRVTHGWIRYLSAALVPLRDAAGCSASVHHPVVLRFCSTDVEAAHSLKEQHAVPVISP